MSDAVRDAFSDTDEVEITVTGRKTGRQITHPVWFVLEESSLFLVPITGSDSNWYKNVRRTPWVQVAANGTAINTSVTPITEPARVTHVVEMFRDKYGADQIEARYPKHDVAVQVPIGR